MIHVAAPAVPAVVTSLVFTSAAFIAVALRLYTRIFMLKNAGAGTSTSKQISTSNDILTHRCTDDYLMVGAMVC
jgi:hypothetical protein